MYRTLTNSPRLVAIIPAAGVGTRAVQGAGSGVPKQYRAMAGQVMLRWTAQAILRDERIARVVVAVSPQDTHAHAALAGLPRTSWLPCGGPTRHATVVNALAAGNLEADDWVLVHDAARPGLTQAALGALIDACLPDAVGGLLAVPVADTLKLAATADDAETADDAPPRVARTLSRNHLWQAQTPQMFRAGLLADAFAYAERNGLVPTDEAGAIEALGHRPLLVAGNMANLKVTWPEDFIWMETWLASQCG